MFTTIRRLANSNVGFFVRQALTKYLKKNEKQFN